jgi:site-specific DNA recombinase
MDTKCLIYCRVSSVRQKIEGHGLDAQEHRCREYAKQKGYEVEKVFNDSFTGGGDFWKRPAMAELLKYMDMKAHVNYVVIFDDLKRFARDINFHWKLRKELSSRSAKVECLNFTFEETPEGEFIESILAAQGQLERKQNQRQVIQKQKARLQRGYWPFNPPPGYKSEKDKIHGKLLTPVEPEASIITEALEGYANGRFQSQSEVQRFLRVNRFRGLKTTHLSRVNSLLKRVLYAGYVEYVPWEVSRLKGHHTPLISLSTHERIINKLSGKQYILSRKDYSSDFPLRGYVLCGDCLRPFTAGWSTGRKSKFAYYRCNNVSCVRHNKSIPKNHFEGEFNSILKKVNPRRETLAMTKAILVDLWNKKLTEIGSIKKEREKNLHNVQAEKATYVGRVPKVHSVDVINAFEERIEELANEELLLKDEIKNLSTPRVGFETAVDRVFQLLKNPHSVWTKGGLSEKKVVLNLVFAEKLVYSYEKGFEHPIYSLPLRAFLLSDLPRSHFVETGGIEPPSESSSQ